MTTNITPLNVLIVEDSEDDYELCLRFLSKEFTPHALRVETEEEFRQALANKEWDVILCDYSLPQFSVLEALKILRTMEKDTPLIVVSGSISEEAAVECIKSGANDYLIKDRLTKLASAVKSEMRQAFAREEHRLQEKVNQHLFKELHNFRAALNASALVSTTDLEGTILSVNELFCSVSGYSEKELVNANHRIVNSDYHSQAFWQEFWTTILSGKIWRGDIKNRAKDGTYYWVDTTVYPVINTEGELFCFMSIRHLITEQKEAALRIAESEIRFRTLADNAPVLVWMTDTEKMCFYISKSWLEFTGRTLEQEMGIGWADSVHPDNREESLKIYTEAFDAREKVSIEYQLRHHTGEYRWMLDIGVPRYLPDGTFAGYIGSCVDITERKKAEEYLIQINEKLEQRVGERTEALTRLNTEKNEFLGIAAHDLKNPLSGIRSSAEIIERYLTTDEQTIKFTQRIIVSCDQMLDIIMNLLDVNKIETVGYTLHLAPLSLGILNDIIQDYQVRAAQKAIVLTYEPTELSVYADAQALQQVLDNLVSNAVKYSPEWAQVSVRAQRHTSKNGEAKVRIEVQDEGPGLTEEDKSKLFTKFARLSAKPTGQESSTGLGLSIVKRLVEAMQGCVWCESEHGKGATFIVELPEAVSV